MFRFFILFIILILLGVSLSCFPRTSLLYGAAAASSSLSSPAAYSLAPSLFPAHCHPTRSDAIHVQQNMTQLVPPKDELARPGQAKYCSPAAPSPSERTPSWTSLDLQEVHLVPHFDPSVTCLGALPDLRSAHAQNLTI